MKINTTYQETVSAVENNQNSNNIRFLEDTVQPDVFKAIEKLQPNHHLLYLRDEKRIDYKIPKPFVEICRHYGKEIGIPYSLDADYHGFKSVKDLQRYNSWHSFIDEFLRQTIRIRLPGFYRGECRYHATTLPSGRRDISSQTNIPFSTQELIDKLKLEDFTHILKTFPNTILALIRNVGINWEALAQHYGLRTHLLDVTCEPLVAAFFATHKYNADMERYEMMKNGVGCIKKAYPMHLIFDQSNVVANSLIGLQPFKRPAFQRAFCWDESKSYLMNCADDLSGTTMTKQYTYPILNWTAVQFQQSLNFSRKIHDLFYCGDECILFPDETISKAAKAVERRKSVTIDSVYSLAKTMNVSYSSIVEKLNSVGYSVVYHPAFKLSQNDFKTLLYEIEGGDLYKYADTWRRPVMLSDDDNKVIEPDESYSTYMAGSAHLILAIFLFGNEAFKIS